MGPRFVPPEALVRAAPFVGQWDWHLSPALAAPLAIAVATGAWGPSVATQLRWRALVPLTGMTATTWALALAASEGWHRVTYPLSLKGEYLAVVDEIEAPGPFLSGFVDQIDGYPVHVQGHPPGMPLLLWAMDQVGLGGSGWAAVLALVGAGVAAAAALTAARAVAGDDLARAAAPFLALSPAAVWLGTSSDAVFAGVIAIGIALLVTPAPRPAMHAGGGAVLGGALFLTYGAAPLLLIPAGVWLWRRNLVPLLMAAAGAMAVAVAFWSAGFWWFDGMDATMAVYERGISSHRSYALFTPWLNPAALAAACGPATAAGIGVWVQRRGTLPPSSWVLPALGLAAVSVANLSGLSKAEVERIWLPFVVWLLMFAALLPQRYQRPALAGQAVVALGLQLALRSWW